MEIEITLPYPPSVNSYKRIGRTITTKRGKILQTRVNSPETLAFYIETINESRRKGLKSFADATISLEVSIDIHPPNNRRSDIDNRVKVTLDALQHAKLIPDDYQIARLLVTRRSIIPQGQIIVRIKPYVTQP